MTLLFQYNTFLSLVKPLFSCKVTFLCYNRYKEVIEVTKGDRIRDLRKAKGITQIDMAKLLSTTKQTISKYEKGIVTNIPSDRIEAMARLLDTTPEYILGWEKNEEEIFADVSPEVEKNNDLIAEVVFKMRTDVDFSNAVSSLLKAFQKQSID